MTQTDTTDRHTPEFQAADRDADEELGWFRRVLRKYTNSFSVARASLFWALLKRQKKTLKWLFIVMIIYTAGLLQVTNLTRGLIDNGIVNQTAPLWDYLRYITFWALWAFVFSLAQQQIADRLAYQIEFDMRVWLYTHIQSADLRRLDQVATGQLVTRSLTDIQLVDTLLKVFPTLIGVRADPHRGRGDRHDRESVHGHPRDPRPPHQRLAGEQVPHATARVRAGPS